MTKKTVNQEDLKKLEKRGFKIVNKKAPAPDLADKLAAAVVKPMETFTEATVTALQELIKENKKVHAELKKGGSDKPVRAKELIPVRNKDGIIEKISIKWEVVK